MQMTLAMEEISGGESAGRGSRERGAKVEITCELCGRKVMRPASELGRGRGRFCSVRCRAKWLGQHLSKQVEVTCEVCGAKIMRAAAKVKGSDHHYCSVECSGRSRRNMEKVRCAWCGRPMKRHPSRVAIYRRLFCSRACKGNYARAYTSGENSWNWSGGKSIVLCAWCGKRMEIWPHKLSESDEHFCNRECMGKWRSRHIRGPNHPRWRGGPVPYGPLWPIYRAQARARDDYTCQRCGLTEEETGHELTVHHIRLYRESYDNTLSNLITLCDSFDPENCHGHCEHHPEECPVPRKWLALPAHNAQSPGTEAPGDQEEHPSGERH